MKLMAEAHSPMRCQIHSSTSFGLASCLKDMTSTLKP